MVCVFLLKQKPTRKVRFLGYGNQLLSLLKRSIFFFSFASPGFFGIFQPPHANTHIIFFQTSTRIRLRLGSIHPNKQHHKSL
ncbi:hypothetical protein HanPI659440_Chr08g0310291 [Helianthus annuus]|nr:hypothetical protein HanPI659440_Chr08g0310291 [Helianthus annuus]